MHQVAWRCVGMILHGHAVHGRPTAAVQEDMQTGPTCSKPSWSNAANLKYKRVCDRMRNMHAAAEAPSRHPTA